MLLHGSSWHCQLAIEMTTMICLDVCRTIQRTCRKHLQHHVPIGPRQEAGLAQQQQAVYIVGGKICLPQQSQKWTPWVPAWAAQCWSERAEPRRPRRALERAAHSPCCPSSQAPAGIAALAQACPHCTARSGLPAVDHQQGLIASLQWPVMCRDRSSLDATDMQKACD